MSSVVGVEDRREAGTEFIHSTDRSVTAGIACDILRVQGRNGKAHTVAKTQPLPTTNKPSSTIMNDRWSTTLDVMFTGIVEELGEVVELRPSADSARLTVRGKQVVGDARHGDSIAVNGVCLTVVDVVDAESFTVDVMGETLRHSGIGALEAGDRVNLERAAPVGGRLGGHIVQGHVDGTGAVVARTPSDDWELLRISLPDELARYVARKGSIAVDGISLTVSAVGDGWFEVSLIPTTRALTTLGAASIGSVVNLEVDVIAKYVERLVNPIASDR